jgi:hypothetical protein
VYDHEQPAARAEIATVVALPSGARIGAPMVDEGVLEGNLVAWVASGVVELLSPSDPLLALATKGQ